MKLKIPQIISSVIAFFDLVFIVVFIYDKITNKAMTNFWTEVWENKFPILIILFTLSLLAVFIWSRIMLKLENEEKKNKATNDLLQKLTNSIFLANLKAREFEIFKKAIISEQILDGKASFINEMINKEFSEKEKEFLRNYDFRKDISITVS